MSKHYPTDILKKTKLAIISWTVIDPELKVGDLSIAACEEILTQAEALRLEISSLEHRLKSLRSQRDQTYSQCWSNIVRLRTLIKGHYGDDSSQYKMIGGTPMSERKPRAQKVKIEQN